MAHPEIGLLDRSLVRYGGAICAVLAMFVLRLLITADVGPGLPAYITFYPAIMLSALLGGFFPGILATAVSAFLTVYWILPPVGTFSVAYRVDAVGVVLFTAMGLFMSGVAEVYRRNRRKAAGYDKESALRKSQEAIRQHREWLRVTLNSIGDAVITTDTEGRVTFINPVAAALTGWQLKEAEGQKIQIVFPIIDEKSRIPADDIVDRVLLEGSILKLTNNTVLITRTARKFPLRTAGRPLRTTPAR